MKKIWKVKIKKDIQRKVLPNKNIEEEDSVDWVKPNENPDICPTQIAEKDVPTFAAAQASDHQKISPIIASKFRTKFTWIIAGPNEQRYVEKKLKRKFNIEFYFVRKWLYLENCINGGNSRLRSAA